MWVNFVFFMSLLLSFRDSWSDYEILRIKLLIMSLCFIFLFKMMVKLFVILIVGLCSNMIHLFGIDEDFIILMKINFFYLEFNLNLLIESCCVYFD